MVKAFNQNTIIRFGRALFCLLFAAVLLAEFTAIGFGESGQQTLNISGTRNVSLSIDPSKENEGFSAILYNNKNGMPTSEANAIAQTSDGFLWIGGYAGLLRYDGTSFERIDAATGIANVRSLYVDSKDRLWIGTNDTGLFLMTKGALKHWSKADGLKSLSIRALAEDENGNLYVCSTAGGIATVNPEMSLAVLQDERIDGLTISELRLGNDGLLYGFTTAGDLFTLKNGKVLTFLGHDECRLKNILSILPDPDHPGNLYVGTGNSRIYYGNLERNFTAMSMKEASPLTNIDGLELINGQLWVCAGNGIGAFDATGIHVLKNVPMNSSVEHVMTDYEGNLWFTSTRQGVMKIVPNYFSDLFERNNLPEAVVNSTCMVGRYLFIGTDNGLLVLKDGERISKIPLTKASTASGSALKADDLIELLEGVRIRSIIRDSKDRIWISTWQDLGLLRYDHGEVTSFSQEDGLYSNEIRAVSECEDGSLLVAHTEGVCILRDDNVVGGYGEKDGIQNRDILTVTEGFNHDILLGSDGDGIYIFNSDGMKHIGIEEGLKSEVVMRIKRSSSRELYWIVTGNSLAYMTPDYCVSTILHFPYPNNYDLYENSKGDIWVISSTGIFVVSADELVADKDINPVSFTVYSGLPYMATPNSYSELTRDGDLYLSGSSGVIKVNIEESFTNIIDLKISMPYLLADGSRLYPDKKGTFNIPYRNRKLTIQPYVFNFSLINPLVTYYLDGFDEAKTTISRNELTALDYTNLPSGTYHFVIQVQDPLGHANKTVKYRIVKENLFTEATAGTIILDAASLFLMGGILVYTSRYRKRRRLEDRLFFYMILSNSAMAVSEIISDGLEFTLYPFVKEIMITGYTVLFLSLVVFSYLLFLYVDYLYVPDKSHLRKRKLWFGIPCFLFFVVMIVNLKTGWIFSVEGGNVYRAGFLVERYLLPQLPVLFYLFLSLFLSVKFNKRLAAISLLLIVSALAWELWYREISSTAFTYTLYLVCIHIYVMNHPISEEAS